MESTPNLALQNTTRRTYFDFIKVFAAFLVIFNHLPGYTLYYVSDGIKEWGYLALTMITRANVPLFLMVSGALLLPKKETFKDLLLKRVLRYVVMIFVANYLVYIVWRAGTWTPRELIINILSGSVQGSYWYLYAYLGMLLMLPFLRKLITNFTTKEFIYLVLLKFILSSLIPTVEYITSRFYGFTFSLNGNFSLTIAIDRVIFYPLAGYYLDRVLSMESLKKQHLLGITAAAVFGIAVSSAITYHQGITSEFTQRYVQLFDYMIAIWIFVLVKYCFTKSPRKETAGKIHTGKFWKTVGSVTFGIYLFDPILKKYLYAPVSDALEPILPTLLVSFAWCLISMVICGTATWLIHRIKFMRKFL